MMELIVYFMLVNRNVGYKLAKVVWNEEYVQCLNYQGMIR